MKLIILAAVSVQHNSMSTVQTSLWDLKENWYRIHFFEYFFTVKILLCYQKMTTVVGQIYLKEKSVSKLPAGASAADMHCSKRMF